MVRRSPPPGQFLPTRPNTYTYNAESEISTAAGLTYLYDGDGKRVVKGSTEVYWYGAGSEILSESHPGAIDSDYIYFGGKRVAWRRYNEPSVIYYEADMLGSSRTTVIAGQTSPWSEADYYPFGGERAINDSYPPNHFKFEGKQRDTETGNDDFGARYYNSRIGRWLSADWSSVPAPVPYANLTNPQTLNLYAMVSDNPETFADLDGHLLEGTPSGDPEPSGGSGTTGENPTPSGTQNTAGQAAQQTQSQQQSQSAQNQSQTKQLTADDVSKGIKAFDSDKGDKNPGRVVKALATMGQNFTATGDVVRAGVKESGVEMPKAADKVLANVESITRTGDKVVITNKDSMRVDVLGKMEKTISFTINESAKGKSGYVGPELQNLKGVSIGFGPFATHPDHWGPE